MTFKDLITSFDLGPSLMDEVFRELDINKPELTDDPIGHFKTIHGNDPNAESGTMKRVNQSPRRKDIPTNETVKTISPEEEQDLDSAIAMAKELATLSMIEPDIKPFGVVKHSIGNSSKYPKTQTSPIKKKFSFKFKNSFKEKRKNFCEKADNISDVQSMLTDEAKLAYSSLIEKGTSRLCADPSGNTRTDPIISSQSNETGSNSYNPLRLIRNGLATIPKVRGNKLRVAITPQTASLARLTANIGRMKDPISTSTPTADSSSMKFFDEASASQNQPPLPQTDPSRRVTSLYQNDRFQVPPPRTTSLASSAVRKDPNANEIEALNDLQMSKPSSSPLKRRLTNEPTYVNVPSGAPEYMNIQYLSAKNNSPKRNLNSNPRRTFI